MKKTLIEKEQVLAMIDYSNITIRDMIDSEGCCEAETNHWIDQFYRMLKTNADNLKSATFR